MDDPIYQPIRVLLTPDQHDLALAAGEARYTRRRAAGSKQRHNRPVEEAAKMIRADQQGVGAEIAVARLIGREWVDDPAPDYEGDVGEGVQVRHTERGRYLIVHGPEGKGSEDRDDHDFFLVTGPMPEFVVVGWMTGAKAKRIGEVKELARGRPCICVEGRYLASPDQWRQFSRWASADPAGIRRTPTPTPDAPIPAEWTQPIFSPVFVPAGKLA